MQIPPAPPKPDFDASREKLQKLGEGEGSMTKEEFQKMKQELEAYVHLLKSHILMIVFHWKNTSKLILSIICCYKLKDSSICKTYSI